MQLEAVHRKLGFALSDIFVVDNYTSEWELEPVIDVLILSALKEMQAADDFLENLPLEKQVDVFDGVAFKVSTISSYFHLGVYWTYTISSPSCLVFKMKI